MTKTILTIAFILMIGGNQFSLKAQVTKTQVLNYISSMKDSGTVLSGQHCGDGDNISSWYGTMMTGLYTLTGKYAAIVGTDYGYKANNNLTTINTKLIEHWKAGYFLQWHSWPRAAVAIKDNLNASAMMNSEKVITRDEVDFSKIGNTLKIKVPTFTMRSTHHYYAGCRNHLLYQ